MLCRLFLKGECKNDTEDYGAYLLLSLIMLFMTWNNQISSNCFFSSLSLSLSFSILFIIQFQIHCESNVDVEINNEKSFYFYKLCRSRFDSVQWSWKAIFSHQFHFICNYLTPNERNIWCSCTHCDVIATEVAYSHFVQLLFTNATSRGKFRRWFFLFFLCLFCFVLFNEEP